MCVRTWIGLPLLLGAVSLAPLAAREPSAPATKVPRWDARGLGPLPWQGVACLDIDARASAIAVGTIAPPGDPNVLLLDGDGKVLRQRHAGQRWINAVGLDRGVIRAVCTMPAGRAGDNSEVFRLTARDVTPEDITWRRTSYAESYFHYGDHSNHVTRLLTTRGSCTVAVNGDQVHWLNVRATAAFPLPQSAIPVAVAAGDRGVVVVGTAVAASKEAPRPTNLH